MEEAQNPPGRFDRSSTSEAVQLLHCDDVGRKRRRLRRSRNRCGLLLLLLLGALFGQEVVLRAGIVLLSVPQVVKVEVADLLRAESGGEKVKFGQEEGEVEEDAGERMEGEKRREEGGTRKS